MPSHCLVPEDGTSGYYSYIVFPIYPPTNESEIYWNKYGIISLTQEPTLCWNLTDPDPYILEALQNPGHWTELFYYKNSTFWRIAWWGYGNLGPQNPIMQVHPVPFKYNGTYYDYSMGARDLEYWVEPLNEEPKDYSSFTNVPWYLQEAINNPGKMIAQSLEFDSDMWEFFWSIKTPFKYNGTYYQLNWMDILAGPPRELPWPRTEYTVAGVTSVAFAGTALSYIITWMLWERRDRGWSSSDPEVQNKAYDAFQKQAREIIKMPSLDLWKDKGEPPPEG